MDIRYLEASAKKTISGHRITLFWEEILKKMNPMYSLGIQFLTCYRSERRGGLTRFKIHTDLLIMDWYDNFPPEFWTPCKTKNLPLCVVGSKPPCKLLRPTACFVWQNPSRRSKSANEELSSKGNEGLFFFGSAPHWSRVLRSAHWQGYRNPLPCGKKTPRFCSVFLESIN